MGEPHGIISHVSQPTYTPYTLTHFTPPSHTPTPTHPYGEREKKKERKRELGKFNYCHLKLKLEIKQGIHLNILKFKHM